MAAKLPTRIIKENLGSVNLIMALFDGTVSSNDIDDNDTWASGCTTIVGWPWVIPTIDGPQDCTIDAVGTDGGITFASAANQTGWVAFYCRNI
jgi:hypothetical protein